MGKSLSTQIDDSQSKQNTKQHITKRQPAKNGKNIKIERLCLLKLQESNRKKENTEGLKT